MIEVFATNIQDHKDACIVQGLFRIVFPKFNINFDLADSDHVLRVESSTQIDQGAIMRYIQKMGFAIRILE